MSQYPGCVIPFGRASKELDPDAVVYGVPFQPDCTYARLSSPVYPLPSPPRLFSPPPPPPTLALALALALDTQRHADKRRDNAVDDPAATDRAPCAVQVVAPKFKDEECLRAAAMIDHVLKQVTIS